MTRKLGGTAAGIAIAIVIMMVAEAIGSSLFDGGLAPDGGVAPAMELAAEANASVLLGWFLAALVGGYVAAWISRVRATAWAVAGVILLAVIFRFALAAAPLWMIVAGVLAPPLGGWIAQRLPTRRRSGAA